jgi:predicted PurR-regulated permease PerM
MNVSLKWPFYVKISLLLIGIYVFICILSAIQDIVLPVIYGLLLAVLIGPLVNKLKSMGIPRSVAILSILILFAAGFIFLLVLLSSQASLLSEAFPVLSEKFDELVQQGVAWSSDFFNIRASKINQWVKSIRGDIYESSSTVIGATLTTAGGVLATLFLTPVYVFMLLYYQSHLIEFIYRLMGRHHDQKIREILSETKTVIQGYLHGLLAEFCIIAVLNSAGLLILGMEYAILLGTGGALLNVIPYLGGLIAVVIYMVVALVLKTPVYALYVFILYVVVQLIDNNYIVPKIVGSKVKLNALVCLLSVLAGSALWGIPGMFLSIPLIAIIKLVIDRIPGLSPWGFLLGENREAGGIRKRAAARPPGPEAVGSLEVRL